MLKVQSAGTELLGNSPANSRLCRGRSAISSQDSAFASRGLPRRRKLREPEELTPLLAIAGAAELFDHAIEPGEVSATKPDPDSVLAAPAWSRTDAANAVMIGDTAYDIDAGHLSGVRCIAFRCGGSSSAHLKLADAQFDHPAALVAALKHTTLGALLRLETPSIEALNCR